MIHLHEPEAPMPHLTRQPPVTLHLGAHRTGTSTLQRLLSLNAAMLRAGGVAVWGPERTRDGLFAGVMGDPGNATARRDVQAHRAAGRIAMLRSELARDGIGRLVVSDENALGGLRENLLLGRLYPSVGPRLRRVSAALPGIDRVVLSIRSPDMWWASAFAFLMTRGFAPPDAVTIEAILRARRGWRQVIEDVAEALPGAALTVWTHETMASRPDAAFVGLAGLAPARRHAPLLGMSPPLAALQARLRDEGCMDVLPQVGGHYAPFDPDARAMLRDLYHDDLAWLRDGADGRVDTQIQAPAERPSRDRRPRYGAGRRQEQMGAAG